MTRPNITEAAEYYFRYIDRVPSDDIMATLENQMGEMFELLSGISEEQSLHSYAPGKWTIREVLNHMNDGERLFAGRALWFARGFTDPLPGFDQDVAVENAHANNTSWADLVEESKIVRLGTISLFKSLPEEAWDRTGVASDNPVSVRAIAYIIAGHVTHHLGVLREKYL